jgi:DNA-binding transcriptional MocR family regulator
MNKLNIQNLFRDNAFLKIITVTKASPLKFVDRLLYSILVYLSAKNWQRSQAKLARLLCMDRATVRRAGLRLAAHGLVETDDSGKPCMPLRAKRPDADNVKWFAPINASGKSWQHSFSYLAVPWPDERLPDGLSWQALLIYSFLYGRVHAHQMDRLEISAEEMSRILRLDGRSVRKALGQLEAQLLIESFPGHRIRMGYPDDNLKQQFRSRRKVERPVRFPWEKPWENMTESEIFNFIDDAPNDYVRLWRIMRYRGHYISSEIAYLRKLENASVVGFTTLSKFYHKAERDHRKSQESGQYQNNSSFNLLLHRLKEEYGPEIEAARKK